MTFKLGLTGSIGMGKSTTAGMFRELGYPVWDADDAVHRLYLKGGAAVKPVAAEFPAALKDGAIDKQALIDAIKLSPDALNRLESIVHPLVAHDRQRFVERHKDSPLIVMDIPLLFENSSENEMDGVVVVSAPEDTQRARVMARPGMSREKFQMILSRQMPDAEKRARADWVIPTVNIAAARAAVEKICAEITGNA